MTREHDHIRAARSAAPLTRADVELLRSNVESSAQLDLSLQNLRHIDLSYIDLHGANLRGAKLQGANLRGTNLSDTDLQGADLSNADLNGADLSRTHLGDSAANRVDLRQAKLSYATLRELDLRGFDLTGLDLHNTDLNGTDLRAAILHGTDLSGADLSTAQLHGPELRDAILYRGKLPDDRVKTRQQDMLIQEPEIKQIKKTLSEREAYLFGEQMLLAGSDPVKLRQVFAQGFTFALVRQLFDAWLVQSGDSYHKQEIQAMWIGFAHRICDLYHEEEPER
ncbi:MAG: pentapeptide repeat-containing protein [Chloroflexota bacterium]|nr:pentapeptide repeat-containing protein [Chloroflexota bacterium]